MPMTWWATRSSTPSGSTTAAASTVGPFDEGHAGHARAVGVRAEGHDLSADDAALVHEHVHAGHQGVRHVAVLRDDLDGPGLAAELSVHALLANRDGASVEAEEPDAGRHDLPLVVLAGAGRHPVVVDLADRHALAVEALHEVAERHVVAGVAGDADDGGVRVGCHDLGQGDVRVDEAVGGHRRRDDGEQVRLDPEVLARGPRTARSAAVAARQLLEDPAQDGVEVGEQGVVGAAGRPGRRGRGSMK